MPELPEVETVARTIYPHIHNCVFTNSELLKLSSLHPLSMPLSTLTGMRICKVSRRGKLLVFTLEAADSYIKKIEVPQFLIIHLRMTGRVFSTKANEASGNHTRCKFGLKKPDGTPIQLFFDDTRTFGKILVATSKILDAWPFWHDLGPEPFEINTQEFAKRLKGTRALKSALLDQTVIAGIGNIYADESLFQARILPGRAANSLSGKESNALLSAIKDVLTRSIAQCGSSIRDYLDADGNAGAFQNTFMVYGRGGQPCKVCGNSLCKTRISGRATVFCPHCQK